MSFRHCLPRRPWTALGPPKKQKMGNVQKYKPNTSAHHRWLCSLQIEGRTQRVCGGRVIAEHDRCPNRPIDKQLYKLPILTPHRKSLNSLPRWNRPNGTAAATGSADKNR